MAIERLELTNFTAFDYLNIEFSPGINIFIGKNGTGKTMLLKLLYSVLYSEGQVIGGQGPLFETILPKKEGSLETKLIGVFLPHQGRLGRLVKRSKVSSTAEIRIYSNGKPLTFTFSNHSLSDAKVQRRRKWTKQDLGTPVYIPVKEMLAHGPGLRSLYKSRLIHFPEIYIDILDLAYLPSLRGRIDASREKLLGLIRRTISGKVEREDEFFFLRMQRGKIEFPLVAEGMRKLALIWLLIQNGTLLEGSTLFWDEPEANLNPELMRTVIDILLELQRNGIQIFLASHSYVVLKLFDLLKKESDSIAFHSLFSKRKGHIACNSTKDYLRIDPNAISDTYANLYDEDIERALKRSK
ncbi:AAA family ATPase [candidate division WOR-3 bacterium]|uniref:AAA family ATPase n=1 Tax=candidate division WOR-3 bacterium TaxID=2052148 RepID=A0A9D5KBC5_UNCW3|nr:AAA family ATPase [candidate division WOR-3 bacterium]MBD3365035.1 AAA family ATPase [candidate division WOR-3 bacterium]